MLPFILSGLFAVAQCASLLHAGAALERRAGTGTSPNLERDLKVLQAFAGTVSGPSELKANWSKEGNNVCNWDGIFCLVNPKTTQSEVFGIQFTSFALEGNVKLDGFLDKLVDLRVFQITDNTFTGTVPDLSHVKNLNDVDISANNFTGPFPKSLLTSSNLVRLDIRWNEFTGELPSNLFEAFPRIETLFLNNNAFSGKLPSNIGKFSGKYLTLANSKYDGPIPASFGGAKNLKEVLMLNNKLSGNLPSGLGALVNLVVFDASANLLTGPVPEELCAIKTLEILNLAGNAMDKNLGPKCSKAKKDGILKM